MRQNEADGGHQCDVAGEAKRPQSEREAEAALRELMETCMLDAAQALRRRRASVDMDAPIVCPLCSGRLWNEQVLTPSIPPSGRGWTEAYRYGCERCDFESNTGPIWDFRNDMTLREYLCGNEFRPFDGGSDPLRDHALSQRFARDSESRLVRDPYDELKRCANEHGVDFALAAEEAQGAGIIQHVDVVTDVELEHIKAAIAAFAKERERGEQTSE